MKVLLTLFTLATFSLSSFAVNNQHGISISYGMDSGVDAEGDQASELNTLVNNYNSQYLPSEHSTMSGTRSEGSHGSGDFLKLSYINNTVNMSLALIKFKEIESDMFEGNSYRDINNQSVFTKTSVQSTVKVSAIELALDKQFFLTKYFSIGPELGALSWNTENKINYSFSGGEINAADSESSDESGTDYYLGIRSNYQFDNSIFLNLYWKKFLNEDITSASTGLSLGYLFGFE